ncbi:MAG: Holliday junction branch migration protein RuvA [Candidatus Latescibacterota bacterium]|nr:MAG: Holliday junction branch migration protein RuvA [Candidatus Latescibacterota bacterium]
MISTLRGRLAGREPAVVVEVGGLGLSVNVSARTAAQLPGLGDEVSLLTYLHVREDRLTLYGFTAARERALFLLLLGVSGIGPRLALTLLSSAPLEEIERALHEGNEAYLVRLPGLGRKTAARLIVELQGKVSMLEPQEAARVDHEPLFAEAVLALASLGLTQRAARDAVESIDRSRFGKAPRVEEIVKAALQVKS